MENGNGALGRQPVSPCLQAAPPGEDTKETDRCSLCAQASQPGRSVTSSSGLWREKSSSQLGVRAGGRSIQAPEPSGFPALHNFSISANYICHFPPSLRRMECPDS